MDPREAYSRRISLALREMGMTVRGAFYAAAAHPKKMGEAMAEGLTADAYAREIFEALAGSSEPKKKG